MGLTANFLASYVNVLSKRIKVFVVLNMLFLDSIFMGVLLSQFLRVPSLSIGGSVGVLTWILSLDWPWMVLAVFLFNLVLSGLVVLVLPGLAFFPLSAMFLAVRGALWGIMFNQPSTVPFVLLLPTLVLEGEGYVLVSMSGTVLGLSWLKPNWVYRGEQLSRLDALKTSVKEALRLLFLSAILLFSAAVVETITISVA
jgi:hypothetical protein